MYRIFLVFGLIFCVACNSKDKNKSSVPNISLELEETNESTTNTNTISTNHKNAFEVIKIDSIRNFYTIYTKKKGTDYKIVSERVALSKKCRKIKKGDFLSLELVSIVPDTSKISYKINGVEYKGTEIEFEGDSILDIYESKNLKGLCYSEKK